MRTAIVFVVGLAIGTAMSPLLAQGDRLPGVNNMNHIAIAYENFDEAFDFYTKKMGFKEGFTVRNAQGQPTLSYIQASRDTFIEIQPANANRRPGLNHYGLHVADLKSYVAALKQRDGSGTNGSRVGAILWTRFRRRPSGPRPASRQTECIQPGGIVFGHSGGQDLALPGGGRDLESLQLFEHTSQPGLPIHTAIRSQMLPLKQKANEVGG